MLGLDDTSLYGRPSLIDGHIEDIYAENGFVVVKDEEYAKLENPAMGTTFELNDNRGVIVGVAKVPASGLFGIPTLYTTFSRAVQYIPSMRYTVSFILIEPRSDAAIPHIQDEIHRLGYDAVTEQGLIGSAMLVDAAMIQGGHESRAEGSRTAQDLRVCVRIARGA